MIEKKFLRSIRRDNMLSRNDTVLVGVSGGPDSVALLHLLNSHKEKLGIRLVAAHLDHGIRGAEAKRDAQFVKDLAEGLGIECILGRVSVPLYAKQYKLSIEDAARQARYRFLNNAAKEAGADKIAVGHNADDNVETFLMRVIRGTGYWGLEGIPAKRGMIVRPLIDSWRAEIEAYCSKHGLKCVTDSTNKDTAYTRNSIRHELVPMLMKYNPSVKEAISRLIGMSGEYQAFIGKSSQRISKGIIRVKKNGIELKKKELMAQEPVIRGEIIRIAVEMLKGDLTDVSFTNISDIIRAAGRASAELDLPGFKANIQRSSIVLSTIPQKDALIEYEYPLDVPGKVKIDQAGVSIRSSLIGRTSLVSLKHRDPFTAYIDYRKVNGPLTVRSWKKGDRFRPLGMSGTKKLQDIFVDEKFEAGQKSAVPLVEDRNRIVWVAGYRIDDGVKIDGRTSKVLKLECSRSGR